MVRFEISLENIINGLSNVNPSRLYLDLYSQLHESGSKMTSLILYAYYNDVHSLFEERIRNYLATEDLDFEVSREEETKYLGMLKSMGNVDGLIYNLAVNHFKKISENKTHYEEICILLDELVGIGRLRRSLDILAQRYLINLDVPKKLRSKFHRDDCEPDCKNYEDLINWLAENKDGKTPLRLNDAIKEQGGKVYERLSVLNEVYEKLEKYGSLKTISRNISIGHINDLFIA